MAKRQFKLPGIQDLSKEQENGRALPLDGQHLIIGGPGTGKSVLALLRAKRLNSEKKQYVFLVFNHLLNQSSRQLFGAELVSQQWQSWFLKTFNQTTGISAPRLPAQEGSDWEPFDWDTAYSIAAATELSVGSERPYLIIDEGQDMPPGFYQCLANLGFENLYVVADGNQQLTDENSREDELMNALCKKADEVIHLTTNYRNKYSIARLALEFYTRSGSLPAKLPAPPKVQSKLPMLYAYPSGNFNGVILRIVKMADRMPNKLIGLIAPNNFVRNQYFCALRNANEGLDHGEVKVSTSFGGAAQLMAFDEGGIMVINAQACKGLEFDVVFIVGLDNFRIFQNNTDQAKRLFYVMVARAIDTVIMLQDKDRHSPIEAILPQDTQILERY